MGYGKSLFKRPVVIPNGTALANVMHCNDGVLVGVLIDPAGWTAAPLTFLAAPPNDNNSDTTPGTLYNLHDQGGAEITVTGPAAGRLIMLEPAGFAGLGFLQVRSGPSGAPVSQGAARTLTLLFRNLE